MTSQTLIVVLLCTLAFPFAALAADKPVASDLDFTVKDIDGKQVNLAQKYKGKVVLVVNVASKCGYTPQYKGLEALHEKYAPQDLAILGFPCNQFGKQEPGSESEIKDFCSKNYDVKFDLFHKVDVNGPNAAPLYKHLEASAPADKGDVKWNFEKFLIGRDGKIVKRYRSKTTPEQIAQDIEAQLAKPAPASA